VWSSGSKTETAILLEIFRDVPQALHSDVEIVLGFHKRREIQYQCDDKFPKKESNPWDLLLCQLTGYISCSAYKGKAYKTFCLECSLPFPIAFVFCFSDTYYFPITAYVSSPTTNSTYHAHLLPTNACFSLVHPLLFSTSHQNHSIQNNNIVLYTMESS
jgi:hypothetical protein